MYFISHRTLWNTPLYLRASSMRYRPLLYVAIELKIVGSRPMYTSNTTTDVSAQASNFQ